MKKNVKRTIPLIIAFIISVCVLSGSISATHTVSAAEENVERYTIFGSLDGYEVVVSGEHVYDGQTLGVGTRFSTSENCRITKIRKYFGQEEHGTFVAAVWSGETGELIRSYEWTLDSGKNGWEELVLPEPIEIEAQSEYVVEIENTKDSPYYVYVRGYFEDTEIAFFDILGGNSVFTENVGNMPANAMGGSANFLVDVEVEYTKPVPTATSEPSAGPTEIPATELPATESPASSVPAVTDNSRGSDAGEQNTNIVLPIIIASLCCAVIIAAVITIVVIVTKKRKA